MHKHISLILTLFLGIFMCSCSSISLLKHESKELSWDYEKFPLMVKYTKEVNQRTVTIMKEVIEDLNYQLGFKAVFPFLMPFSLSIAEMDIDHSKLENKLWLTNILMDNYVRTKANKKPFARIKYNKRTGEILASYLYIFQNWGEEKLETHLRHELGHTLGLDHSVNPFSAMYKSVYEDLSLKDFDGEDIRLLRKKYLGEE